MNKYPELVVESSTKLLAQSVAMTAAGYSEAYEPINLETPIEVRVMVIVDGKTYFDLSDLCYNEARYNELMSRISFRFHHLTHFAGWPRNGIPRRRSPL